MKVQVTLYHRMGAGSYGVADDEGLLSPQETFEQAHANAWKEWHAAFGSTPPVSVAIDPAPLRTDENLRAARIAPLLREDATADTQDDSIDEKAIGFFEDLECFLKDARWRISQGELHEARDELRHLAREIADLDATLAHHLRTDG